MTPTLFTDQEWNRLNPQLQALGDVAAAETIVEVGSKIFAEWDAMNPLEQAEASAMAALWPHEVSSDAMPLEITEHIVHEGAHFGTPRYAIWERVRETRHRLDMLREAQKTPAQREADIAELVRDGIVADRETAIAYLRRGTMQDLRDIARMFEQPQISN